MYDTLKSAIRNTFGKLKHENGVDPNFNSTDLAHIDTEAILGIKLNRSEIAKLDKKA